MIPNLFISWLTETSRLQIEVYKANYAQFDWGPDADPDAVRKLIAYIDVMFAATMHEMVELHDETAWKPWQHDEPYVNRDAVMKEAIDALHFIANILAALDVSDQELTERYYEKMQVNRDRQERAEGYHVLAAGEKCRTCKRALDDVPRALQDRTICQTCYAKEMLYA